MTLCTSTHSCTSHNEPLQKGCWTCKDRKISCDGTLPTCLKCSKSKRQCAGYGYRLSWPRTNDHRRHVIGPRSPMRIRIAGLKSKAVWINAFSTDIGLHHMASTLDRRVFRPSDLAPYVEDMISQCSCRVDTLPKISVSDKGLLQYFEIVVCETLPMLDSDRDEIRRLLLQMAFRDDSSSSKAIMDSILALASLHRNGDQSHATTLKGSAIRALIASSGRYVCCASAMQHIASAILLSIYEVQQTSQRSSHWMGHIAGAKEMIRVGRQARHPLESDFSAILRWFNYHEILLRFSIRHWRSALLKFTAFELDLENIPECALQFLFTRSSFSTHIPELLEHSHPVLRLVSEVFNTMLYASGPKYHSNEYQNQLEQLEFKLTNIKTDLYNAEMTAKQIINGLELFRLAGLVYLERAARNFSGKSLKLDQYTEDGFTILCKMDACPYPFPLFIFGCEAESEERRISIMDLIVRTEQQPHGRNFDEISDMIERAWIQQDLVKNGEIEYIRMLNLVFSIREPVPSVI